MSSQQTDPYYFSLQLSLLILSEPPNLRLRDATFNLLTHLCAFLSPIQKSTLKPTILAILQIHHHRELFEVVQESQELPESAPSTISTMASLPTPNDFIHPLSQLIHSEPHNHRFRDVAFDMLTYQWSFLSHSQQSEHKPTVLTILQNHHDHDKIFLSRVCDFISKIASQSTPTNAWPELFSLVTGSMASTSQEVRLSAISLFSYFVGRAVYEFVADDELVAYDALSNLLEGPNGDSKSEAVMASITYLLYSTTGEWGNVEELVDKIFLVFYEVVGRGEYEFADNIISKLNVLTQVSPELWEGQVKLKYVIECMLTAAENSSTRYSTTVLAMDFITRIAKQNPIELEDSKHITRVLALLIKMISVTDHKPLWEILDPLWKILKRNPDLITDNDGEGDEWETFERNHMKSWESAMCLRGIWFLEKIATALGGGVIFSSLWDLYKLNFPTDEWQKHFGFIISLAVIAKSGLKELDQNMHLVKAVVGVVDQGFHPHLVWAALVAIESFSLLPISKLEYQIRMDTVANDFENPRNQVQATSTMFFVDLYEEEKQKSGPRGPPVMRILRRENKIRMQSLAKLQKIACLSQDWKSRFKLGEIFYELEDTIQQLL